MAIEFVKAASPASIYTSSVNVDPDAGTLLVAAASNGSNDPTTVALTWDSVAMNYVGGDNDEFRSIRAAWEEVTDGQLALAASGGTIRGLNGMVFSGVDTADPIRADSFVSVDNAGGAGGTEVLVTVPCQVGDMVVVFGGGQNVGSGISFTGATEPSGGQVIEDGAGQACAYVLADGTSEAVTVTFSPGNNRFVAVGFALKPAGGGGGGGGGGGADASTAAQAGIDELIVIEATMQLNADALLRVANLKRLLQSVIDANA